MIFVATSNILLYNTIMLFVTILRTVFNVNKIILWFKSVQTCSLCWVLNDKSSFKNLQYVFNVWLNYWSNYITILIQSPNLLLEKNIRVRQYNIAIFLSYCRHHYTHINTLKTCKHNAVWLEDHVYKSLRIKYRRNIS